MSVFHLGHFDYFVVPLLLALWTVRGPLQGSPWPALIGLVYVGINRLTIALTNIRTPHEWDYGCFWLYGHVAASHQNVYDPKVFAHFALPFLPSAEFTAAVINVGFPYPPPTIALFLPLGLLNSMPVGLAAWYVIQVVALAAAAWLLARTCMPAAGLAASILIFTCVLALPATQANVGDAQTNFLLLLAITLAFVQRTTTMGAVWQLLAFWIKPYVAALFLVDLVGRKYRRLGAAALTAIASFLVAALVLGPRTVLAYFTSNPAGREPAYTFVEPVNQSLLAVILRARGGAPVEMSALHEPIFVGLALLLAAITAGLCLRAPRGSDLAFALALVLGMLLYPATLASYGVILIVPLLVLWNRRDVVPGKAVGVIALSAVVAVAQGPLQLGFVANLAVWLSCAGVLAIAGNKANQLAVGSAVDPLGSRRFNLA